MYILKKRQMDEMKEQLEDRSDDKDSVLPGFKSPPWKQASAIWNDLYADMHEARKFGANPSALDHDADDDDYEGGM